MDKILKEKKVAEQIGMSVHWLRRMRWRGGGIPFVKVGGCVRYRQEDVSRYINSKVRNSTCDTEECP